MQDDPFAPAQDDSDEDSEEEHEQNPQDQKEDPSASTQQYDGRSEAGRSEAEALREAVSDVRVLCVLKISPFFHLLLPFVNIDFKMERFISSDFVQFDVNVYYTEAFGA